MYRLGDLIAAKFGGDISYEWHEKKPYRGRYWAYSQIKMKKLESDSRLVYTKTRCLAIKAIWMICLASLQEVWNDIWPAGLKIEASGYPTNKPELRVARLIRVRDFQGLFGTY